MRLSFRPCADSETTAPPARVRAAGRTPARRWRAWLAVLVLFAWPARADPITDDLATRADVLQHLATFIEWPAAAFGDPGAPFVIAVFGEPVLGAMLQERMAGAYVGRRAIVVHQVEPGDKACECHILYVAGVDASHLAEIWRNLRGRPVLTVGEGTAFVQAGGMVGLDHRGPHKALYLNTRSLRDAGLSASSKLLEVAHVVDVVDDSP